MRTVTVAAKVSASEEAEVRTAAARLGVTVSGFLRAASLAAARRLRPAAVLSDTGEPLQLDRQSIGGQQGCQGGQP
jgi:hypothetical protein